MSGFASSLVLCECVAAGCLGHGELMYIAWLVPQKPSLFRYILETPCVAHHIQRPIWQSLTETSIACRELDISTVAATARNLYIKICEVPELCCPEFIACVD